MADSPGVGPTAAVPVPFGAAWSAGLRRGEPDELDGWVAFALELCDLADAIALRHFRRDLHVTAKPDRSLVTQADTAIEAALRERILARFPDAGLVGEEYGAEAAGASLRWFIDPIDGTHNYVRGVPVFATLLAVERDGELQAGIMSAPALGTRWHARRGGGAWVVGPEGPRRAAVSGVADLGDAQVLTGSGREAAGSGLMPGLDAVLAGAWRERGFGDFWGYALVAEGAAEAMIEVGMHPWDLAPIQVLLEEAGGRATALDGRRTIDDPTSVASNGILHDELLRRLRVEPPAG